MSRNPPWDADERALALELYLRRQTASKTDPEVLSLSEALNRRARLLGISGDDQLRNPAGVALKLANFAALDPSYPGSGMVRFSRGDVETWERYSGDSDELRQRVDEILETVVEPMSAPAPANRLRPLEDETTREYLVRVDQAVRTARRREAQLVQRFAAHLRAFGHVVGVHHHEVEGVRLRLDLVDESDRRIWEAKYEVGRNAIRLAIGQLADYRRFEPSDWRIGILLARQPASDLLNLCASVGAVLAWPDLQRESFVVHDSTVQTVSDSI